MSDWKEHRQRYKPCHWWKASGGGGDEQKVHLEEETCRWEDCVYLVSMEPREKLS